LILSNYFFVIIASIVMFIGNLLFRHV